ncbi:MAG TPA: molybdopterin converting factor subunit 1 [Vineibacter sp.]|nr:molybdopterin converting factor subunit 1 [Vineibacter sp.]
MKVKYFAWLRRRTGVAEEDVSPPDDVRTVQQLIDWLARQSPRHAEAFAEAKVFGAAVDQQVVQLDAPIAGAREVAFFPPFTGG